MNYIKRMGRWATVLILLCCISLAGILKAQDLKPVTGKVADQTDGSPVPGVSILIKGTHVGTATDADGNYQIQAKKGVVLVFTAVGYVSREVLVTADVLNVEMTAEQRQLDEVVVIGYGTQTKKELTGSIATVSSKDFQKGNITTPDQLISGKVAGVSITAKSGAPGAGSTIRIRGGASLAASNDPLIVVDGVPLSNNSISGATNPLSLINPNDISSFTVLKDAAATAIYGSRASNGVILITTKSGASGSPKINFNTQMSVNNTAGRIGVLDANAFRQYVKKNGNDNQIAQLGNANTDWQDEIYQTALGTDNNLSISGTYKKMPYRISGGYLNQAGVLVTDKMNRTSAAISLKPSFFSDHLKIDLNLKGALTNTRFANQGAIGAAVSFDPTQPVFAKNQYGNYFEWLNTSSDGSVVPNLNATRNPVALLALRNDRSQVKRSYGNIQFDYSMHFLPELHANLNLGYDVSKGEGNTYVPAYAASEADVKGLDNHYRQGTTNTVAEFYLNYNKDISSWNSNINATAGYGYYDFMNKTYFYPSYNALGEVVAGTEPAFPFDKPRTTLISYYGRLIYTLAKRYILAASIRTDGSSKFAPENRWGLFPSVAFTWRANEESFLKDVNALSDLKLRLSYGVTGQQDGIPYYSYIPTYSLSVASAKYLLGDTYYSMYAPGAYDRDIKWEQTATYNAGIDFGFLENRLSGSVDAYFKKTRDLLNTIPIPLGSNFNNVITTNVGNIENKGLEAALNGQIIRKKDFTWDAGVNFTYNVNKITKLTKVDNPDYIGVLTGGLSGAVGNTIQINSVGYNTYAFYTYHQVYDANGKPLEGVYKDMNGDGIINEKDLYRTKSSVPKAMFGFSTQVSYKRWSLSTVLRSNLGNYVYNNVQANLGVSRNILNANGYLMNATKGMDKSGFVSNEYLTDYYLENGSFLRMDNLGIGYDAGKVFGHDHPVSLRLSANCQNVFVITNYTGLDPEISSGIDSNFYPRPRTFVLGVNLDF
ncbi:iron complex outermembrane recepter protein [bacterium A37T11]|nr:iron complex outermembrane recepter protein [bacterium A37T11]